MFIGIYIYIYIYIYILYIYYIYCIYIIYIYIYIYIHNTPQAFLALPVAFPNCQSAAIPLLICQPDH